MKIFAIRDESAQEQKDLAYLLYYEQEKSTLYLKSEILKQNWQWSCVIPLYTPFEKGIKGYKRFWAIVGRFSYQFDAWYTQCPFKRALYSFPSSISPAKILFAVAAETLHSSHTSAFMIYSCVCKNCSIFCQRRVFLSIFPSLIASLIASLMWMRW